MRAKPGASSALWIVHPKIHCELSNLWGKQHLVSSPSIVLRPCLGLSNPASVRSSVMAKRKLETGEQKLTASNQPQKAKKHKRKHEVLPVVDDFVTDRAPTSAANGSIESAKADGGSTIPNREILERLEELKRTVMEELRRENGTPKDNGQMAEEHVLQESVPMRQKKKKSKHKHKEGSRGQNKDGDDDDQAQRHMVVEKASRSTEGQEEIKHKPRDKDRRRQKRRLHEDDTKDNSGKNRGRSAWGVSEPIAGHLDDLDPVFSHDEK